MFLIILFVQITSFFVYFVPLPYCLTRLGVGDALAMLWPLCVYVCVYIRPLCIAAGPANGIDRFLLALLSCPLLAE